jgi:hypothetical protein
LCYNLGVHNYAEKNGSGASAGYEMRRVLFFGG